MTDREKYLEACNFAIMQLTGKGSCSVVLDVHSDNPTVVNWKDVLEWLDKEYQACNVECGYSTEEIAKSFIEDVEAVKDQLPTPTETLVSLEVYKQVAKERDIAIEQLHELGYEFGEKTPKESCDDCMWSVCNYNKMVDCCKLLEEVSDKIEEYVCNEVEDHAKAQGMCDALTMIEDYFKEHKATPKESLVVEDCISRADAIKAMQEKAKRLTNEDTINGLCGAVAILFDLPSVTPHEPTTKNDLAVECIDKTELLKAMDTWDKFGNDPNEGLIPLRTLVLQDRYVPYVKYDDMVKCVKGMPSVTPLEPRWIPVSERLPKDLEPVNITWVNRNPESYYANIKDKPFTATGVYFNGQWYWWSTLCTDILAEYSHNYDDIIDDDIEITAWQPLPKAYSEVEE